MQKLFEAEDPAFQNSERASLGYSIDLFPVDAFGLAELREELAGAFSSERRLAKLEQSFQDEVLDAYEGMTGVLTRKPGFANELFGHTLFDPGLRGRRSLAEGQDAASILHKRYGRWRPPSKSWCGHGRRRLLDFPTVPPSASLREFRAVHPAEACVNAS